MDDVITRDAVLFHKFGGMMSIRLVSVVAVALGAGHNDGPVFSSSSSGESRDGSE